MATTIRPELSEKNKYWIDKHRYYELKHFCRQYKSWKQAYEENSEPFARSSLLERTSSGNAITDLTAKYAIRNTYYKDMINLIEKTAIEADEELWFFILIAVTDGLSFNYLKTKLNIPCSRDTYYDRYRRFFWLLNIYRK